MWRLSRRVGQAIMRLGACSLFGRIPTPNLLRGSAAQDGFAAAATTTTITTTTTTTTTIATTITTTSTTATTTTTTPTTSIHDMVHALLWNWDVFLSPF